MKKDKNMCSFCHKTEDDVRLLIAGPDGSFICDECVGICDEILFEELGENYYESRETTDNQIEELNFTPSGIKTCLDDYVIGQEEAKKKLAVAAFNHYNISNQNSREKVEIEKSNILMIGSTGSGKIIDSQFVGL